jgi:transcriptional regulator with GAF, ATPase, and Fis domain
MASGRPLAGLTASTEASAVTNGPYPEAYAWPGNVRELQSVIRAAVVRSRENPCENVLRAKHIRLLCDGKFHADSHAAFDENLSWTRAREAFQRDWMRWALRSCSTAAEVGRRFGVDQKTIKKYRNSSAEKG